MGVWFVKTMQRARTVGLNLTQIMVPGNMSHTSIDIFHFVTSPDRVKLPSVTVVITRWKCFVAKPDHSKPIKNHSSATKVRRFLKLPIPIPMPNEIPAHF